MSPRNFWESNTTDECQRVAEAAGTNLANFKQIALYEGACSAKLAKRLADSSAGRMTLEEILFGNDRAA